MSPRFVAFPKSGDSYTTPFYRVLDSLGIEFSNGEWSWSRMRNELGPGAWAHLHWPSQLYGTRGGVAKRTIALLRFLVLLFLARWRGTRFIWTAHNLYPHDGGPTLVHRFVRLIVTRISTFVVVHGPRAAELVHREFGLPHAKMLSVLCPTWHGELPMHTDRASARALLGIAAEERLFVCVGLLKPYKGIEELIEAFAGLRDDSSRLLIAGAFQSEAYRQRIQRLVGKERQIELREGHVPDDQLQHYYVAADFTVLAYRAILTSGNANMAMGFGCPVIAPALGSIPDHVPEFAGILYDPKERGALSTALSECRSRRFDRDVIREHAATLSWERLATAFAERLRLEEARLSGAPASE